MKQNGINRFLGISMILFISLTFISCSEEKKEKKSKATVAVSTFVLYDISKHIAQDTIDLVKMIPAGVDIHAYEPTPKLMAEIEMSDLVLSNGAGLEPWISSFSFKNKSIAMGDFVKLKHRSHEHHEEHGHQCSHSALDPHIWFDIENMKRVTDIITYEFISLHPQHKELYVTNRDKYIKMLNTLDAMYKQRLGSCKLDTVITDHNAFAYLSSNYGFNIKTLSGVSPDAQVSPQDIIRIMNDVKKYNVPVVFFENFTSDKSMKSLATQVNVEIESLHPLGNITKEDLNKKHTYNDIMMQNLEKISKALVCQ